MPDTSRWFKLVGSAAQETADTPRVVSFPHSGGSARAYRPLAAELTGVDVVAVQYPGRQDRHDEPIITDLHLLADRIADALRETPADTPSVFFGHSMGAILAYEVAQRLGDEGPLALIASGRPAPSRVRPTASYLLDDTALAEQVARLGGTAPELLDHPEMRSLLLPLIRGDYQASETYRPHHDRPLNCPLTALGGDTDPVASPDDIRAWSAHTTGPFRMKTLSGGHFYLQDHWPSVADLIRTTVLAPKH